MDNTHISHSRLDGYNYSRGNVLVRKWGTYFSSKEKDIGLNV